MNLDRYDIKKLPLAGFSSFGKFIEVPVCKDCGAIVGDIEVHDADHDKRNRIAQAAFKGEDASYWVRPIG